MLGTDKYVMPITFIVDKEHASGLPCSHGSIKLSPPYKLLSTGKLFWRPIALSTGKRVPVKE